MLDGKAYTAHFPDDPAYDFTNSGKARPRPESTALREALAALESEFRTILKAVAAAE